MQQDKELNFVDASNYQSFQPTSVPNYTPVPNYSPSDGSLSSRLMNARMVRIRVLRKCVCSELTWAKPYFHVNAISKIDDLNPINEHETPLLEAELYVPCCCPEPIKYIIIDTQTRQQFSISQNRDMGKRVTNCCSDSYFIFPDILNYKISNPNDLSITKCYDTRSFYRTFEYNGNIFYKIGNPYVPKDECCTNICGCCMNPDFKLKKGGCCEDCCKNVPLEKRIYVDIFNMADQCVGKYVRYFDQTDCFSCTEPNLFFEIYFPSDANEMLKLALIGHLIFIMQFGPDIFGVLPGSKDNLSMFINPINNV